MDGSTGSNPRTPSRANTRAYLVYMYAVTCLGLASIVAAVHQLALTHVSGQWLIFVALTIVTSSCTIRIPGTNSKISVGDTFFFTNVILYGIPAGILTAAVDALVSSLRARNRSRRIQYTLFNVAAIACSAQISGLVFFLNSHRGPLYQQGMPPVVDMFFPLAALAFTHYLVNSGSVAVIVALEKQRNIFRIWRDSFLWTSITYFAGAAAGGFIALAIGSVTLKVVGVVVPVILAVYLTYKTYLDKVQQIRSMAYFDSLTGLPNRIHFKEQLNQALTVSEGSNQMLAVMFLDLDNFKRINDSYGHSVGDSLLRNVAARLRSTLRYQGGELPGEMKEQTEVIGRFGGDEFTMILAGVRSAQEMTGTATRILQEFANPFDLDGQEVSVTVSIGISMYPADGKDADTLLKNADAAMFHAKDSGRSGYQFYSQSMNDLSLAKLSLENDLRKALGRRELQLQYQPKVNGHTKEVTGAEALVRWQHPTRGLLSADEFIPLAEETGLIRPMGEWILRAVCQQIAAWESAGLVAVPVAVNLSCLQFRGQELQQLIARILEETAIDPTLLQLEITESIFMQNVGEVDAALRDIRQLGCKIHVDDFGTGYSSLSRLKRFTLDALKIDRSFVTDLSNNPDDMSLIKAILALARSLEMKVIAEGVETEQQYQFLKSQGCDEIQGYLFGRPMPVVDFTALLRRRARIRPAETEDSHTCRRRTRVSADIRYGLRPNPANLRLVPPATRQLMQPATVADAGSTALIAASSGSSPSPHH
jgi:diguanylate cyclase (GGDEF)-like protein